MRLTKLLNWIFISITLLITLYFAFISYIFPNYVTIGGGKTSTMSLSYTIEGDADTSIFNYPKLNLILNKAEGEYRNAKFKLENYTKRPSAGSSTITGPLGIACYTTVDTTSPFATIKTKFIPQESHYLILNNYTTKIEKYKQENRVYYTVDGKFYKKELVIDTATQRARWYTKQIKYFPIATENESKFTSKQLEAQIFLPITKGAYTFLNIFSWILLFALLITILHLIIGNIIKVAIAISKGKAFTEENYHWLLQAGVSLLSLTLLNFFIHLIFYLIFLHKLDTEWKPDVDWFSFIKYLSISTFVILLAFAFKKGTRMQQEQDLTI